MLKITSQPIYRWAKNDLTRYVFLLSLHSIAPPCCPSRARRQIFLPSQLGDLNQQPFSSWSNALSTSVQFGMQTSSSWHKGGMRGASGNLISYRTTAYNRRAVGNSSPEGMQYWPSFQPRTNTALTPGLCSLGTKQNQNGNVL